MKKVLIILFLSPFTLFSQSASTSEDSTAINSFFSQVKRVELCELKKTKNATYTYERKRRNPKVIDSVVFEELTGIIENGELNFDLIQKKLEISDSVKLTLHEILMTRFDIVYDATCYEPRNGILFYDKNNLILGYLEICFACREVVGLSYPGDTNLTETQFQDLKKLFVELGLRVTD